MCPEGVSCCAFFSGWGSGGHEVWLRAIRGNRYGVKAQRCSYVTCIGVPVVSPVLCSRNVFPVVLSFWFGDLVAMRCG